MAARGGVISADGFVVRIEDVSAAMKGVACDIKFWLKNGESIVVIFGSPETRDEGFRAVSRGIRGEG